MIAALLLALTISPAGEEGPGAAGRAVEQPAAGGTIRGRITDRETGQPLPRFRVSVSKQPIQDETTPGISTAISDADGSYELTAVPAGTYTLTARPPQLVASHLPQIFGQEDSPAAAGAPRYTTIDVRPNATLSADFAMRRSLGIEGRIATEEGDPLAGLIVSVERLDARAARARLETDDRGFYRHYGLAPGRYRVCAAPATTGQLLTTCYPAEPDPARATGVTLTSADARNVDIVMRSNRRFTVSGELQNSAGGPLDGGGVSFVEENARPRRSLQVQRLPSGRFVVSGVEPGTYMLRAELTADGSGRAQEYASMEIAVADSDVAGIVLRAHRPAIVAGVVTFEDGAPAPGASAMIVEVRQEPAPGVDASAAPTTRAVRENLTFELPLISEPARIGLTNLPDGWIVKSILFHDRDVTDEPVVFEQSSDSRAIEIVLTNRVGYLTGSAAGSAPGRTVVVLTFQADRVGLASRPDASGGSSLPVAASAPADDKGTFTIGPLAPGEYLVVAVDRNEWFDASLENRSAAIDRILPRAERVRLREGDKASMALRMVAVK